MKIVSNRTYLDYDDVLIVPGRRTMVQSRNDVDLSVRYTFVHSDVVYTGVPIMAANMARIGIPRIAALLEQHGMFTCLHKHFTEGYLDNSLSNINTDNYSITIGISDFELEIIKRIFESDLKKPTYICIDIANGHMDRLGDQVMAVREIVGRTAAIIAGNVVTGDAAADLCYAGADIIKVGIGPGSACTTRIKTGCGVPQLSAVSDVVTAVGTWHGFKIIADGGCTNPGDVAKAFAAGADFVMLGGMLAGHDETGTTFVGSSSVAAMGKLNSYRASEGREVEVPLKGPLANTLQDITGGLRSACSYVGVDKLADLHKHAQFVKVNSTHNRMFEK